MPNERNPSMPEAPDKRRQETGTPNKQDQEIEREKTRTPQNPGREAPEREKPGRQQQGGQGQQGREPGAM
jgi:hypothetical protein